MKKIVFLILISLIALGLASSILWPVFTPSFADAEPMIAGGGDGGGVYLMQEKNRSSFVYHIPETGKIDAALRVDGDVTQMAFSAGALYLLKEDKEAGAWTLLAADAQLAEARTVAQGGYDDITEVLGFSAAKGALYLSGVNAERTRVITFAMKDEDSGFSFWAESSRPEKDAVRAACDGQSVYIQTEAGDVLRCFGAEQTKLNESPAAALTAAEGTVAYYEAAGGTLGILRGSALPQTLAAPVGGAVRAILPTAEGAAVLTGDEAGASLEFAEGTGEAAWAAILKPAVTWEARLHLLAWPHEGILATTVILAAAFLIAVFFASLSSRLAVKTNAVFAAFGVFLLAVLCVATWLIARAVVMLEAESFELASEEESFLRGVEDLQEGALETAFMLGGIALVFSLVVAALVIRGSLKPLRSMAGQIERFSEGNFDVDGVVTVKGELGAIQSAISEMGVSLAIHKYEMERMATSFYRFVPRRIEKVLDRAGVMEIEIGDVTSLSECVAYVSAENRDAVRTQTDNRGYMDFVSDCTKRIFTEMKAHNGVLLSNDLDLSALPILFSTHVGSERGDGVRFGKSLIDRTTGIGPENSGPEPDFFVMLHKADFLYGIAGAEERAFPVIASAELNFLRGYGSKLRALGIRMAATDKYLREIAQSPGKLEPPAKRYVGFLASDDSTQKYKVYEILDCLSDKERELRLSYDEKLQDAIRMFYRDDFYLAMVEFSSILKANPQDALARWYVFACEKYFDEGDEARIRYNLFGTEEDA